MCNNQCDMLIDKLIKFLWVVLWNDVQFLKSRLMPFFSFYIFEILIIELIDSYATYQWYENIKLCASFQSHWWIQTGVIFRKRSMWVEWGFFHVTLKFDGWHWKKGVSSIVRHALCIISKPSVNQNWNYSLEMLNLGQNVWFSVLWYVQIWWMTLNKANLRDFVSCDRPSSITQIGLKLSIIQPAWPSSLCYIKLCASFQSHGCIQTGVTVHKHWIWVTNVVINFLFCSEWPWNKENLRDSIAAIGLVILLK